MLFSVESTDQFDNSTRSVDCTQQQFRTIQASLYQELAAENFQQTQGQRGFEVWCAIEVEVRSEDPVRQ